MEHSKDFELTKSYYDQGLWSKGRVYKMVVKGKITPEEYEEIVGEVYE